MIPNIFLRFSFFSYFTRIKLFLYSFKARETFEKGLQSNYVKVDDLATVWCEYVEMELKLK